MINNKTIFDYFDDWLEENSELYSYDIEGWSDMDKLLMDILRRIGTDGNIMNECIKITGLCLRATPLYEGVNNAIYYGIPPFDDCEEYYLERLYIAWRMFYRFVINCSPDVFAVSGEDFENLNILNNLAKLKTTKEVN